jgi:hypothetical protein
LIERAWTRKDPRLWEAIGRVGARVPTYASAHYVLAPRLAEGFLRELLREKWTDLASAPGAAHRLARLTGDRARDLPERLRNDVATRLDAAGFSAWAKGVREVVAVDEAERVESFGDALPLGLRLVD